ncbi:MAG: hypothetical protein ACHQJ6_04325 [Candidatus Berkiellales bacterium]
MLKEDHLRLSREEAINFFSSLTSAELNKIFRSNYIRSEKLKLGLPSKSAPIMPVEINKTSLIQQAKDSISKETFQIYMAISNDDTKQALALIENNKETILNLKKESFFY